LGNQESGVRNRPPGGHREGLFPAVPSVAKNSSGTVNPFINGRADFPVLITDSWLRFSLCLCAAVVMVLLVPGQAQEKTPPVRVNVLNVCTPGAAEQKELAAALARIPPRPRWGTDFEVARGRTTLSQDAAAALTGKRSAPSDSGLLSDWVRIRREFSGASPFLNALYSFSVDKRSMVETLVFAVRDPKDLLQVSLSETVSAVTTPAAALSAGTPPDHIRLERFGKPSVVLARCAGGADAPKVDQSAYEPLFRRATTILATYRTALGTRRIVPEELARVQPVRAASPLHPRQK